MSDRLRQRLIARNALIVQQLEDAELLERARATPAPSAQPPETRTDHRFETTCEPATGFGWRLRTQRERARLSQAELARQAGLDESLVSLLESGRRNPGRETVLRLAEALQLDDVQIAELLAEAGFMPRRVEDLLAGEPDVAAALRTLAEVDPARAAWLRQHISSGIYAVRQLGEQT